MNRTICLLLVGAVAACSDLPPLGDSTCGNGVIDPGEDCDGPAPACLACRVACDVTAADACATLVPAPRDGTLYRCGADDLCHAPSGRLDKNTIATAPFPVLGFGVTDVDGDHVGDVVGLSPSSLVTRFGSVAGAPLERELESLTPKLTGPPSISHLDADASLDFVLPSADGLVAYTAKNLVLAPRSFAIKYSGGADQSGPLIVPRAAFPIDDTRIGLVFEMTTDSPPTQQLLGGIVDVTLAGHMPQLFPLCSTDYDGNAELPGHDPERFTQDKLDTYVLPNDAGTIVAMLGHHLQGPAGSTELCVLQIVPPPSSAGDATIVPLAKTDGLGAQHVALANLTTTAGECPAAVTSAAAGPNAPRQLRVYAGTGTTTCTLATTPTHAAPFMLPDFAAAIGRVPVALAGATVDALVTENGTIYGYVDGATPTAIELYRSDRSVDQARVGDVDKDGVPDLVLASSTEPNIDILYADVPFAGKPTFRRVRTGTNGAPHHLVVGDFDGDGADDALYFEAESASADRMQVVYGGRDGATVPSEEGEFAQVIAAVPIQLLDTNDPFRRVRDLAVGEQRDGELAPVVDLLHGATQRAMIPYIDPRNGDDNPAIFTAPAIGRFVLPTGNVVGFRSPDLASVAVDPLTGASSIWVLKGASEGSFEAAFSTDMAGDISHSLTTGGTWGFCGQPGVHDFCLDNAGAVNWPLADHDLYVGIDTVQGNIVTQDLRKPFAPVYSRGLLPQGAHVGNAFPVTLGGAPKLAVFSDRGALACDLAASGAATCTALVDADGGACVDGALGRIDAADPAPALIALCAGKLVRFTDVGVTTTLLELALAGAMVPASIAIGDVTGDGVDDIVLGNGAAIVLLRQQTSTEAP